MQIHRTSLATGKTALGVSGLGIAALTGAAWILAPNLVGPVALTAVAIAATGFAAVRGLRRTRSRHSPEAITRALITQQIRSCDQERAQRFAHGAAVELGWRLAPGTRPPQRPAADDPRPRPLLPLGDRDSLPESGFLKDLFDLYGRHPTGRTVITAAAGGGKSSILLRLHALALEQAAERVEDVGHRAPVPVLLRLSDWQPQQHALVDFAVESIIRANPHLRPGRVVRRLRRDLFGGEIALFLDGLDQMSGAQRPIAVQQINDLPRTRVILTSRPEEFEQAQQIHPTGDGSRAEAAHLHLRRELAAATVLELRPVERSRAADHLRDTLPDPAVLEHLLHRLDALRDTDGPDPYLPLFLSLLRGFPDPAELLTGPAAPGTAEELTGVLLRAAVPNAYRATVGAHVVSTRSTATPTLATSTLPAAAIGTQVIGPDTVSGRALWLGADHPVQAAARASGLARRAERWLTTLADLVPSDPPQRDGSPGPAHGHQLSWSDIGARLPRPLALAVHSLATGLLTLVNAWCVGQDADLGLPLWVPIAWGMVAAVIYALGTELDQIVTRLRVVGLAVGIAGGTLLGMMLGLLLTVEALARGQLAAGVAVALGLAVGSGAALVCSLALALIGLGTADSAHADASTGRRRRGPCALRLGVPSPWICTALGIAALTVLFTTQDAPRTAAPLVLGSFAAAVLAQSLLSGQAAVDTCAPARRGLRDDALAWAGLGAAGGLSGCLLFAASFGATALSLPAWLCTALTLALLSSHAGGYLLAVGHLWATGRLPLRPLRFLEDASRRGVMRQIGGRFEFGHELLLAALRTPAPVRVPDLSVRTHAPTPP